MTRLFMANFVAFGTKSPLALRKRVQERLFTRVRPFVVTKSGRMFEAPMTYLTI